MDTPPPLQTPHCSNRIEVELRGMMGKVQEMDKRKHEVELELANKVAELETKVRNVTFLV